MERAFLTQPLRSCVTAAALAPVLLALAGALLGFCGAARLTQHDATATVQRLWQPAARDPAVVRADVQALRVPALRTGFGPGQSITVAATGSQPDQVTFGDATGQGVPQALFAQSTALPPPAVDTLGIPWSTIFVGNAQARHQAELTLIPMVRQGRVEGVVHLEGRESSLGGYVAVGEEVHILAADGGFSFSWGGGPADIWIKAPGHLAVVIPQANVASGQVLTIPALTLPFGDANGDGRIDVLDLSIAAANFGEATSPVALP